MWSAQPDNHVARIVVLLVLEVLAVRLRVCLRFVLGVRIPVSVVVVAVPEPPIDSARTTYVIALSCSGLGGKSSTMALNLRAFPQR